MPNEKMKAMNRLANQVYAANSVGQVASFQDVITVSVSSKCNYRCLMCAEWRKPVQEDLPPATIEKLEAVLPFVSTLSITGGEPLLYPHLDKLLGAATKAGCAIQLVTNGALLDQTRLSQLLGTGHLEKLKFSLDAVRPATYTAIRGGDLRPVLDNLRRAVTTRNALGLSAPYVEVGFVAMRQNIDELSKFVVMASRLGVDVIYVAYMAVHHEDAFEQSLYFEQEKSDALMLKAASVAQEVGIRINLPPLFTAQARPDQQAAFRTDRQHCSEPWRNMFLWPNGDVSMCCGGGGGCGNLNESSFSRMWNHPARIRARTLVNTPNPPKACQACFANRQRPDVLRTHFTSPELARRAAALIGDHCTKDQ